MTDPTYSHFHRTGDGLRLHFKDFGSQNDGTPVLCLAGLTRNSRDFDDLAAHLSTSRRVLTLDFRGRGQSDRDPNWRNYHPGTYVDDVRSLLDALGIARVIVIGTSLGGLCAMLLAWQDSARLAGVIMNDVGPEIAPEGLERVKAYTGRLPPVANWDEAVAQVREVYGHGLPGLSEQDFAALARRSFRANEDGVPELDFDPAIGRAVREVGAQGPTPWDYFDAMAELPVTVLWGEQSDILTRDICDRMQARKPDLEVVPVPNRGHVPLLDEPASLRAIDAFLARVP